MIIEALLDLVYSLLDLAVLPFHIPVLPEEAYNVMDDVSEYIEFGLGFLASFTHLQYLLTLFSVVIAVESGFFIYKLVMWILKKVPIANIK